MGQRMEDKPIVYGDNCLLGFPANETPEYLYIRFIGIEKCPDAGPFQPQQPPNDRVFKLTQDAIAPCAWIYLDAEWDVEFYIFDNPLRTRLTLHEVAPAILHFSDEPGGAIAEGYVYTNDRLVCVPNLGGHKGIAVVTWTPQATEVLELINMEKGYDLFMELFPLADGKLVYKFCRIIESTNIKILFQP